MSEKKEGIRKGLKALIGAIVVIGCAALGVPALAPTIADAVDDPVADKAIELLGDKVK